MTTTAQGTLLRDVRLGPGGPRGDVLITDGRVAQLGAVTSQPGEVVDCRGGTVLPGLWDAHVHMLQWASARRRVDLSGARSAQHAAALMAAAPAGTEPLLGYGFRDALWPDGPDAALLGWAGTRPVAMVSHDLHTCWLNGAALRLIGRDGGLSGTLREADSLDAVERLGGAAPAEMMDAWVAEAATAAAARGVVGFTDFEHADNLADWSRRARAERLGCRVSATVYPQFLDAAIEAGYRTGDVLPGTDGMVTVGPLKVFVDGSLNARTALCDDPYPLSGETSGARGLLVTPPAHLRALMARAAAHGIDTAVHAIGDRAMTIALDAFTELGLPGRIEHAQLIAQRDLARVGHPGLILGVQPAHAVDDRDVADQHWAGRTGRAFAYADLLRAGARLEIGSDAPVSPMDPWIGIAAAVYRSAGDREPWHPEQSIPLARALSAAARGRRVLAVGEPADLVIVGQDPGEATPDELRHMPVHATFVAGRCTYAAAG